MNAPCNNEISKYGRDSKLWLSDGGPPIRNFELDGVLIENPSLRVWELADFPTTHALWGCFTLDGHL